MVPWTSTIPESLDLIPKSWVYRPLSLVERGSRLPAYQADKIYVMCSDESFSTKSSAPMLLRNRP